MKKISLIIFVLVSLKLSAQNQRFKKLSLNEGLSQSTVNCVIQDRLGFIWIGTQDGLNKYDGHKFKHYKNSVTDTNSIPDNFVQSLFEDSKGNIWIGTYGNGLAILNPKTNHIKRFNSKNSNLEDDIIMSIIEYENLIYIGTKRAGLYSYSDESKSIEKLRFNKIENNIQIIDMELFNNALYICSSLKGIHKLENNKWNTILDSIRFQSLHSTKESIWYGSHSGKLFQSSLNNSIIVMPIMRSFKKY